MDWRKINESLTAAKIQYCLKKLQQHNYAVRSEVDFYLNFFRLQ